MDIQELISFRTSRRSYTSEALSPAFLDELDGYLKTQTRGPLGSDCRFYRVSKSEITQEKVKLGTYGFIQGARHFIVGHAGSDQNSLLDYAFLLEEIILHLTNLGYGTCWLGGTFDRGEFAKTISLPENQVIPAITPFGKATKNRSIGDRLIRAGAGSKKRKAWDELFFDFESKKPLSPDHPDVPTSWLEMVRLAPSASNNQPWRIMKQGTQLHLFLSRKPGYQKMFGHVDIQMLDIGIAMCHLAKMAEAEGITITWSQNKEIGAFFDWKYVVSAKPGSRELGTGRKQKV